jgi:threonyl-tRNA synthetase
MPHVLVIGDKEMSASTLSVRDRGSQDTREIEKEAFIKELREKIRNRE